MRRRRAEDVVVGQVAVAQLLAPDERVVRVVVRIGLPDEEDREHREHAGGEQRVAQARRRPLGGRGAADLRARSAACGGRSRTCAGRSAYRRGAVAQAVDLDHGPGPLVGPRAVVERGVVGEAHGLGALGVGRERDRLLARGVERGVVPARRCAGPPSGRGPSGGCRPRPSSSRGRGSGRCGACAAASRRPGRAARPGRPAARARRARTRGRTARPRSGRPRGTFAVDPPAAPRARVSSRPSTRSTCTLASTPCTHSSAVIPASAAPRRRRSASAATTAA